MRIRAWICLWVVLLTAVSWSKPKKDSSMSLAGLVYNASQTSATSGTGYDQLAGVEVTINDTNYKTVTDNRGGFHFEDLKDGDYMLTFSKPGYATVTKAVRVDNGTFPAGLTIAMMPQGMQMGPEGTITGPGTVYIAFSERNASLAHTDQGMQTQQTVRGALAAGADPFAISSNAPMTMKGPKDEYNPTSEVPNSLMIYPPGSPTKTGFVSLDAKPYWVCFNGNGSTLFISTAKQMIMVYDALHNNTLLRNIPTPGPITEMVASPDGRYVAAGIMGASPCVLILDTATMEPTGTVPCPINPWAVAIYGNRVYAVGGDAQHGVVMALDGTTGTLLSSVPCGTFPTGVAITPDGKKLFVANSGSASLSVFDALTMAPLAQIPVGVNPQKVAISPDGARAFVTNKQVNSVSVIDVQRMGVIATTPVGQSPVGLAVNRDSSRVFIACKDAGTVWMLDGKSGAVLHTTVPMPLSSPFGVAVRP